MSTSGTYQLDGVVFPRNPLTKRWSRQRLAAGGDRRAIHSDLWQLELSFGTLTIAESAWFAGKYYAAGLHTARLPYPDDGRLTSFTGVSVDLYSFSFGDVDSNAWALNPRLVLGRLELGNMIEINVAASVDDGQALQGISPYPTNTESILFGTSITPLARSIGIRYSGVLVPKDAVIIQADLTLTALDAGSGLESEPMTANLSAESADSPGTVASRADYEGRTRTTPPISWSPPAFVDGLTYVTPELTAAVQEIVNRPGWNSGQAMHFFIEAVTGTAALRTIHAFDSAPAKAALLRIIYG